MDVHRVLRSGGIEFRQRRQSILLKLSRKNTAYRCNESTCRHIFCTLTNNGLKFGYREGRLNAARFVSGPAPYKLDMEVVVNHSWNHGAASQVDCVRTAAGRTGSIPDFHKFSVSDANFRHNGSLRIHGVNFPVGQQEHPAAGARLILSRGRAQHRDDQQNMKRFCYEHDLWRQYIANPGILNLA